MGDMLVPLFQLKPRKRQFFDELGPKSPLSWYLNCLVPAMKKILIGVGTIAVLIGILWTGRAWNTFRVNAKTAQFNDDVDTLFIALKNYNEHVGSYPVG